ncbi:MAG: hypothetical protein COA94_03940 [Rickettsiales bacterium]|nr:MAG: hypothetical protein COA94_03940 [Rickettsiales bacterium]
MHAFCVRIFSEDNQFMSKIMSKIYQDAILKMMSHSCATRQDIYNVVLKSAQGGFLHNIMDSYKKMNGNDAIFSTSRLFRKIFLENNLEVLKAAAEKDILSEVLAHHLNDEVIHAVFYNSKMFAQVFISVSDEQLSRVLNGYDAWGLGLLLSEATKANVLKEVIEKIGGKFTPDVASSLLSATCLAEVSSVLEAFASCSINFSDAWNKLKLDAQKNVLTDLVESGALPTMIELSSELSIDWNTFFGKMNSNEIEEFLLKVVENGLYSQLIGAMGDNYVMIVANLSASFWDSFPKATHTHLQVVIGACEAIAECCDFFPVDVQNELAGFCENLPE